MKKNLSIALFTLCLFCVLVACGQTDMKQEPPKNTIEVTTHQTERKSGPDCDKPDSLRYNCVEIDFNYPYLQKGSESLKNAIEVWANDFMVSLVAFAVEPDNLPPLEEAIQSFINLHDESTDEFPDASAYYFAQTRDTILLNDNKYLTIKMDGFNYAGGAHPNSTSQVATWSATDGSQIKLEDIIADLPALQRLAEKKFEEVRAEDFKEGFSFDEIFTFKLADNTGLVRDGIYFCYVPYEVAPYVMGFTEFVIPYSEIEDILK